MIITVHRDAWDWAVVWSTVAASVVAVIAVLCAIWAIHRSNMIARNADAAQTRERQLTSELAVLARLAEACGSYGYHAASPNVVRALLDLLSDKDLPGLRASHK
jgi:hypothetical protein